MLAPRRISGLPTERREHWVGGMASGWASPLCICAHACILVRMKPFNIKLSDEHRAKLETYRAACGLRSEADAVRDLIDRASEDAGSDLHRRLDARPRGPVIGESGIYGDNRTGISKKDWAEVHAAAKVQIGPVEPKPGSRLKGAKGK